MLKKKEKSVAGQFSTVKYKSETPSKSQEKMQERDSNAPAHIGGRNRQVHSSEGHTAADTEKETGNVRNKSWSSFNNTCQKFSILFSNSN